MEREGTSQGQHAEVVDQGHEIDTIERRIVDLAQEKEDDQEAGSDIIWTLNEGGFHLAVGWRTGQFAGAHSSGFPISDGLTSGVDLVGDHSEEFWSSPTTLCEFLADFGVFGKLDIIVGLILHDDGFKVNVVTNLELGHIDVRLPGQSLAGIKSTRDRMEPEPQPRKIMAVRSARQVPVRVRLLDDDTFNDSVDKRGIGWVLFDKVCEHLNIIEKDYFGLNYKTADGEQNWLNNDKKIAKQMKGQNWNFSFEVKFYPADPAQLAEDLTRYQLCLQIRRDIVNEKLPCSFVTYTLLGSYTAQSELGDYDPEEFGSGYKYLKDIQFAPHQDKELLIKIAELHRQHKGQTPEESELKFLENAKKLALYGVELHPAKGLLVYKDKQQVNRFVWPKVLKMSYRRNKFFIKIRPGEFEEFASLIGSVNLNQQSMSASCHVSGLDSATRVEHSSSPDSLCPRREEMLHFSTEF
ncbi:E41L3-like protein [Mya arenaria]|uniref:E41L3-like protein n=1 Tax=Mya arenaria TaxID=6604 RepID=A0ABY7DUD7_MYAAR|nr:E41L3-like protein [Mya arenaria]